MTNIPKYPSKGEGETSRKVPLRRVLCNQFPVELKKVKTEMIKPNVHILNMLNLFRSGNKMEQKLGPDA